MIRDLREAVRLLGANAGFATVVVLTLALGIGVNSTIFSVLHGVLLRPLQYASPDELVVLWEANPQLGQPQADVSGATYLDWRARSRTSTTSRACGRRPARRSRATTSPRSRPERGARRTPGGHALRSPRRVVRLATLIRYTGTIP